MNNAVHPPTFGSKSDARKISEAILISCMYLNAYTKMASVLHSKKKQKDRFVFLLFEVIVCVLLLLGRFV